MKKLFNIREVADLFGVTRKSVYEWVQMGRLPQPVNRKHGDWRWDSSKLLETFQNYQKPRKRRASEDEDCRQSSPSVT